MHRNATGYQSTLAYRNFPYSSFQQGTAVQLAETCLSGRCSAQRGNLYNRRRQETGAKEQEKLDVGMCTSAGEDGRRRARAETTE